MSHSVVYSAAQETATDIRSSIPNTKLHSPRIAIVCGSGLGGIADTLQEAGREEIPYAKIPNFPHTTVVGHAGKLVFGFMSDNHVPVVLLVGRAQSVECAYPFRVMNCHPDFASPSFYEGHSMELVTFATRTCKLLGVEIMIGMLLKMPAERLLTGRSDECSRRSEP